MCWQKGGREERLHLVESDAKIITSSAESRRENKFFTGDEHFPQCFLRLWLIEMNDGPNTVDVYDPSMIKRARAVCSRILGTKKADAWHIS